MLLVKLPYRKALPKKLNTHQVAQLAKLIHRHVADKVSPMIDGTPKYAVFAWALDACEKRIDQLDVAIGQRHRKHPTNMRAVGPEDKTLPENSISQRKRRIYEARRKQIRFLKERVNWDIRVILDEVGVAGDLKEGMLVDKEEKRIELNESQQRLVLLASALEVRMAGYESFGYLEAQEEFDVFFERIESGPDHAAVQQTIEELGLMAIYQKARRYHDQLRVLINDQAHINARRKESPNIKPSDRDLRKTVRHILSLLHMDVENGDDTLRDLLADVDKLIDKEAAVAEGRATRKENKKLANERARKQEQNDDTKQVQASRCMKGEVKSEEACNERRMGNPPLVPAINTPLNSSLISPHNMTSKVRPPCTGRSSYKLRNTRVQKVGEDAF